jgi:Fur family transcriptional regulator, ferric uptake regulator
MARDGTRTLAAMAANAPRPTRLHETISVMLRAQQQRLTPTRTLIVDVLEAADRPLTIPEILDSQPALAQSSAYRNLVVLEQARVVHRLVTHADFARYELAEDLTGHHHHLVCSNCGRVEDLPATAAVERSVAVAIDEAARRAGFRTEHHRLDLVGLCADCMP